MKNLEQYENWCKENNLDPMKEETMARYNRKDIKKEISETVKFKDIISDLLDEDVPVTLKKSVRETVEECLTAAKEAKDFGDFIINALFGE